MLSTYSRLSIGIRNTVAMIHLCVARVEIFGHSSFKTWSSCAMYIMASPFSDVRLGRWLCSTLLSVHSQLKLVILLASIGFAIALSILSSFEQRKVVNSRTLSCMWEDLTSLCMTRRTNRNRKPDAWSTVSLKVSLNCCDPKAMTQLR